MTQSKLGFYHLLPRLIGMTLFAKVLCAIPVMSAEAEKSPLQLGGAIRINVMHLDYNPQLQGTFAFDTLIGNVTYDDKHFIGSGHMRFYRYITEQTGGSETALLLFPHHLWCGYRFQDQSEVNLGISVHPFGLYPYTGYNFFQSIAWYAGLEDTQSLGIKYARKDGALETQLAFYPTDGGSWWATKSAGNAIEQDAVHYSFHALKGYEERNTFIVRTTYTVKHSDTIRSEFGASYLNGEIDSSINQGGRRYAAAVHYAGLFGPVELKLEAVRYDYQLQGAPDSILIGAFGYANKLATQGNIYIANLSYTFEQSFGPFNTLTLYNNFSMLQKNAAGYVDSIQNSFGFSFKADKFLVFVDYMLGQNATYMSPASYEGMGPGKATNNYGERFNLNIGYYF